MPPATGVQFNALHIDQYMFIRHHNLPEHLLDYDDIDNILLVLRSVIGYTTGYNLTNNC